MHHRMRHRLRREGETFRGAIWIKQSRKGLQTSEGQRASCELSRRGDLMHELPGSFPWRREGDEIGVQLLVCEGGEITRWW